MQNALMVTGAELFRIRQRLQETQVVFARRFGVHQSTLQRWEAHGIPGGGTARFAVDAVVDSLKPRRASAGSVAPSRGSGTTVVDQEPIERDWKF